MQHFLSGLTGALFCYTQGEQSVQSSPKTCSHPKSNTLLFSPLEQAPFLQEAKPGMHIRCGTTQTDVCQITFYNLSAPSSPPHRIPSFVHYTHISIHPSQVTASASACITKNTMDENNKSVTIRSLVPAVSNPFHGIKAQIRTAYQNQRDQTSKIRTRYTTCFANAFGAFSMRDAVTTHRLGVNVAKI